MAEFRDEDKRLIGKVGKAYDARLYRKFDRDPKHYGANIEQEIATQTGAVGAVGTAYYAERDAERAAMGKTTAERKAQIKKEYPGVK